MPHRHDARVGQPPAASTAFAPFAPFAAFVALAAVLVAALGAGLGVAGPAIAAEPRAEATGAADPQGPAGWVQAKGKAHGSGLSVSYATGGAATPGQTMTVRLRVTAAPHAEGASVSARDMTDGRTLLSMQLAPGESREVALAVLARGEGMQFVDIQTTQGGRTSVVSVPLQVGRGKVVLRSSGKPAAGPAGEAVVVMPAETNSPNKR